MRQNLKFEFNENNHGGETRFGMIRGSNGNLYGMSAGIQGNLGLVYEFNPNTGNYSVKHEFNGKDGKNPFGGLCEINGWVGIEKSSKHHNVNIYPNPSKSIFNFTSQVELKKVLIEVYNIQGNKVHSMHLEESSNFSLDLSKHSNGLYLVHITSDQSSEVLRIIKN